MKTSIVALALLASRTRADVSLGRRLTPGGRTKRSRFHQTETDVKRLKAQIEADQ